VAFGVASKGEGLGNKFLANIRETDAICQVRWASLPRMQCVSQQWCSVLAAGKMHKLHSCWQQWWLQQEPAAASNK
jgi:hypothetical protein